MKFLKWVFIILGLLFFLIFGLLKNHRAFSELSKNLIEQSGIDLKYKKLSGSPLDGLSIEGLNYEDKIKGDVKLKVNFSALKDKRLEIEEMNISNLSVERDFLNSFLDKNSSSKSQEKSSLPLEEISIKKAHLDLKNLDIKEYHISNLTLDIKDLKSDLKNSHRGKIKLSAKSNVAKVDANVELKGSRYSVNALIEPKEEFLQKYLNESNITLKESSLVKIKADGDRDRLDYDLHLLNGEFSFKDIVINPKDIHSYGDFTIKSGDLNIALDGDIKSSVADLLLNSNSSLNINDINSSLKSVAKLEIRSEQKRLRPYIKDENLSIILENPLILDIKANMKEADINLVLKNTQIRYNDLLASLDLTNTNIKYITKTKELNLHSNIDIDSNISKIRSSLKTSLKLDDINTTLKYELLSNAKIKEALFKSLGDEKNISISKLSPLSLKVLGDAKKLKADLKMDGSLRVGELKLQPRIQNSTLFFDLISHDLSSSFDLGIKSNKGDLKLSNNLRVNIDDINNTLHFKTDGVLKDLKEYKGVNLSTLGDVKLNAVGNLKDIRADIESKILRADLKSVDLDNFDFGFDIKRVKLSKLYKDISPNLKDSFFAMEGKGSYKISKDELLLHSKLKEFDFNGKKISSNRFTLKKSKDSMTLTPTTIKAGNFALNIGIEQVGDDFVARVKNKALKVDAKFKLNPLYIKADGKIRSLKLLKNEINKLYPLKDIPNIDGELNFKIRSQNDAITTNITSPKISLEKGRAERLNIEAIYTPHKIVLKRFEFWQKGFGDKRMNRFVRLRRDGLIKFDDENASVDIDIINLGKFKAKKRGDTTTAKIDVDNFYLHIPKYIKTTLSSHLQVYQSKEKKAITGEIVFKDSVVKYESRFLDVSKDSDIIIVNQKKESDDFIKNTFLDLKIYSLDEIVYKVKAGEVKLKPNIIIRKEFGDTPRVMGKIKILEGGEYDLADKRFYIKEGAVAFRGLKEINPLLDLHVAYEDLDEIKIFIDISGDKNRPRLKFSSKPPRSKKDIFSYLLFGMSASESEGAMSSANKAAERIFGRAISKDLARELHLDRLDLNRNSLGGIDVKAGKKVGKKTIIYYQNKSTQSSVIVERKLSKDWDLSVEAGKEGEAIDFVYRKGFK